MKKVKMPEATESTEQQRLFQWARLASGKWPERELTEAEKHPEAPGCCVTCCHYRAGKAQDCAVFKTTAGIRDDQCGMQSPI